MIKYVIFSFVLLSFGILNAQSSNSSIAVGDILIISQPVYDTYKHVDFPRKNTIIKRGAIANFNGLMGLKVVVDELKTSKNGSTIISLKRIDGKKFFRFYETVTADFNDALNSGEIKMVTKKNS
jgi:hypothetical protein